MSYVYVMACDDGTVKVGRSHDPGRRLVAIQTARSTPVTLAHASPVHPRSAVAVEATAHAALAPFRVRGEWFRVDAATAISAVERAIERHEAALHPAIAEILTSFEARLRDRLERAVAETVLEMVDELQGLPLPLDPASRRTARRAQRSPEATFLEDVIVVAPGDRVQARDMYAAYVAFAARCGRPAWTETRFGRWLSHIVKTDRSSSRRYYLDVRLTAPAISPQPD